MTCIGFKPQWEDAHVNNFLTIQARELTLCVCYLREKYAPFTNCQPNWTTTNKVGDLAILFAGCHSPLKRVNSCQKHPNILAQSFYCVLWCTDHHDRFLHCLNLRLNLQQGFQWEICPKTKYPQKSTLWGSQCKSETTF